eukprot:CAMPEP_0185026130 /NCGR_PEP_ID=MMETSP1103-20130426/10040_1 /TAXON_ID=36769 /ORGANISM="Paraphysomonas bandaiensis, Strain Caron Lab Isolate" /LENGTH=576 /DNA_ID=CAMNT_0027559613 /DNA_START=91 /DNA_END=1821 /DNA_ORIENTATION=-
MSKSSDKDKWYPGKYIKENREKRKSQTTINSTPSDTSDPTVSSDSTPSISSEPIGSQEIKEKSSELTESTSKKSSGGSSGFYFGKYVGRKPPKGYAGYEPEPVSRSTPAFFPVPGSLPVKTVGSVVIKVSGAKYMSATRPSFEVWVGTQVETFQFLGLDAADGSSKEEFEGTFPVGDITSDAYILIKEEYSVQGGRDSFLGRVVIPLSSYVTPQGPRPPKTEWMMVHPVVDDKNPMDMYRSGLDVLPGSAMQKSKHSLGFLCVEVQLLLPPGPVYRLYLEGEPPKKMLRLLASYTGEDKGEGEVDPKRKTFDPEEMYRTYLRIRRFANTPPAALSPVLRFPEVFILIALFGFICFGTEAHHLPLIFFFVVLINGFLSITEKKNFTHIIKWNSMIDAKPNSSPAAPAGSTRNLSVAQMKTPEFVLQTLQEPLHDAQEDLDRMMSNLETLINIWNFSDMQVSIIFYGALLSFSLISTVVIYVFSIRPLVFVIGSVVLLINSLREHFPELMSVHPASDDQADDTRTSVMRVIKNATTKFWMLLERVPTDKVLEHRHIARTCVVEDEGMEMEDAAAMKSN